MRKIGKKICLCLLAAVLTVGVCGCTSKEETAKQQEYEKGENDHKLARDISTFLLIELSLLSESDNEAEVKAAEVFVDTYKENTFELTSQNVEDSVVFTDLAKSLKVSSFSELSAKIQSADATGKIYVSYSISEGSSLPRIEVKIDGTKWTNEYSPEIEKLKELGEQIEEEDHTYQSEYGNPGN